MKTAYHFTTDKLRDGRPVPPIGKWLEHDGPVVPCQSGLHASEHLFDALRYAPYGSAKLHLVELGGEIKSELDKLCASRRRIIATVDCAPLCRAFARQQALSVAHLWSPPQVVLDYLNTGDESLRDAAYAYAADAAYAAARAACAAYAAYAACAADAAYAAARAADAADAAADAARAAARDEFKRLVEATFANVQPL